jgi:hypothetical protein
MKKHLVFKGGVVWSFCDRTTARDWARNVTQAVLDRHEYIARRMGAPQPRTVREWRFDNFQPRGL